MPRVKKEAVKPAIKATKKTAVQVTAPVATAKKADAVILDVFDVKGVKVGTVAAAKAIFGAKVNKPLLAQAVRVYLANQRSGTAKTKTRSEVTGSRRKIYRQKGTGRARHGAISAPIFVHGGIAFGPRPRDYSLSLPQKMKKQALASALTKRTEEGAIKVVRSLDSLSSKTKAMAVTLNALKGDKKTLLLVLPKFSDEKDMYEHITRAARNIENVSFLSVDSLNTYAVLRNNVVILMEQSLGHFEK